MEALETFLAQVLPCHRNYSDFFFCSRFDSDNLMLYSLHIPSHDTGLYCGLRRGFHPQTAAIRRPLPRPTSRACR
jgi:hypothetical protein